MKSGDRPTMPQVARALGQARVRGDVVHPLPAHVDDALLGLETLEVLATVACRHVVLLSAERGYSSTMYPRLRSDKLPRRAWRASQPSPLTSASSRPRLSDAGRPLVHPRHHGSISHVTLYPASACFRGR